MLLPYAPQPGNEGLDQVSLRCLRRGLLTGVVRWAWSQQIDQGDDGRGKILPGNGIEAAVQLFGECAFVRPPMMRPHDIAEPEDWVFASLLGHGRYRRFRDGVWTRELIRQRIPGDEQNR